MVHIQRFNYRIVIGAIHHESFAHIIQVIQGVVVICP